MHFALPGAAPGELIVPHPEAVRPAKANVHAISGSAPVTTRCVPKGEGFITKTM